MKPNLRLSNLTLAAASAVVMGLGAYSASLRSPLVPDDLCSLDLSLPPLDAAAPVLLLWAPAFAFYRLEGAGLRAQRTTVVGPSQPVPARGAGARP